MRAVNGSVASENTKKHGYEGFEVEVCMGLCMEESRVIAEVLLVFLVY